MIKKNEKLFFEDKLREIIKLSRRKSINLIKNKDKVFFFKHIHGVLNNPDIFRTIKYSNINKDIINDYYNYVMTNEKEKLDKVDTINLATKRTDNSINKHISNQNTNKKPSVIVNNINKNLNKFKTINNFKSGSHMRQQLFELVHYIKNDKETHPNIKISPDKDKKKIKLEEKNFKNYSKSKTLIDLMKKNVVVQEKVNEFIETIKENIDDEDENSILEHNNENSKRNESHVIIKRNVEEPIIILNENKPKIPAYNRFSIQLSKPIVVPYQKKFSIESYRSGKSDLKICSCVDGHKNTRNSFKKNEKKRKNDEKIKKSSSLLTETTLSKVESSNRNSSIKKTDFQEKNDSNKTKFEMLSFKNNKRLSSIQFPNISKRSFFQKRESEGLINFNKLSQSIIDKLENQVDKKETKENNLKEIGKFNLINGMRKSKTSSLSSKKMSFFKNEIICKSCGGIVFQKYNKNPNFIHKQTFLDHNLSFSNSDSSSSEDDSFQRKIAVKEQENVIETQEKLNNKNNSDSEEDDNVNFDNLPELNIRYLTFENVKTPKLALALSKRITIIVILIILCLLFSEPFFITSSFINSYIDQYTYEIKLMDEYLSKNKTNSFLKHYDKYFRNMTNYNLFQNNLFLQIGFTNQADYCNFFPAFCYANDTLNNSMDIVYFENTNSLIDSRRTQSVYIEYNYLYAIYDVSWFIKLGSILNLLKIMLVAFMLWIGSFTFLKDVYELVVKPLEFISKKITIQQNNLEKILQFNDDRNIEEELTQNEDEKEKIVMKKFHKMMETTKFTSFIKKNGVLLIKILGSKSKYLLKIAFNYLNYKVLSKELEVLEQNKPLPQQNFKAIIMIIKIKEYKELLNYYQENFTEIYSLIINIIDLTLFEYFGEITTINQDIIMATFDESKCLKSSKSENRLSNIQPESISNENSDHSLIDDELDLHEEYHSFEGSKNFSINSNEFLNDENEEIKIESSEIKNMNILALISALKILARVIYNPDLKKKLHEYNSSKTSVSLQISLETGIVFQHILNTNYKVETIYTGKDIKKCLEYNVSD
jgi:hypothetical protein